MVNTELLNKKIQGSGKKKAYLAEKCGISRMGFLNCEKNKAEFKPSHISVLCDELCISSLKEKDAIFFAKQDS